MERGTSVGEGECGGFRHKLFKFFTSSWDRSMDKSCKLLLAHWGTHCTLCSSFKTAVRRK